MRSACAALSKAAHFVFERKHREPRPGLRGRLPEGKVLATKSKPKASKLPSGRQRDIRNAPTSKHKALDLPTTQVRPSFIMHHPCRMQRYHSSFLISVPLASVWPHASPSFRPGWRRRWRTEGALLTRQACRRSESPLPRLLPPGRYPVCPDLAVVVGAGHRAGGGPAPRVLVRLLRAAAPALVRSGLVASMPPRLHWVDG